MEIPTHFGCNFGCCTIWDLEHVLTHIYIYNILVGGDWNIDVVFPCIGNVIIPIDELIFFQRGRLNHQPDMGFGTTLRNRMFGCTVVPELLRLSTRPRIGFMSNVGIAMS